MKDLDTHQTLRVWDLPTRLFHWGLVFCVGGAVVSAKLGGNAMAWHLRFGYAVMALLVFRLLWGVFGGHWSRWRQMLYGPAATWRYLRGQALPGDHFDVGHNPLGALSVLVMLAWLGVQVGSGLISDDEVATTGPLAAWVSSETSLTWTDYHQHLGQWGLYAMLGLHVGAVLFHQWFKRRQLIGPMLGGDKLAPAHLQASRDSAATRLFALTLLTACAAAVYLLVSVGAPA